MSTPKKIPIKVSIHKDYEGSRSPLAKTIEAFAYRHKEKLVWIHFTLFVFFLTVMIVPLFTPSPIEGSTAFNNLKLFSLFLFWGLWFPLVFVSVIFTGRLWCGVLCPMGAASEWANKIGLKRSIPRWVRWEGTPLISFLIITLLGQTLDVRDQNDAMLKIFGGTLVFAVLIGFLYGRYKRVWCRHLCPIGLLLGVFSRLSWVHLAPKRPIAGGDRYAEKGVCPTLIDINHKAESRHCIECFRCVKPSSQGGLFLRFRRFSEEIIGIAHHHPNMAEVCFIFMGTGIALGGFLWLILPFYNQLRTELGTWLLNHGQYWIGNHGPGWLMSIHNGQGQSYNWLDFISIITFMLGTLLLTGLSLALLTALGAGLSHHPQSNKSFKHRFIELGYSFAPIAMISIILGLGDLLFGVIAQIGLPAFILLGTKLGLFMIAFIWSLYLGNQLLLGYGLPLSQRLISLLPFLIGCTLIALAWWPALFGWHDQSLILYRSHLHLLTT